MTTRQRLTLLARADPQLFPRRALENLLRAELGSVDALDRWEDRGGIRLRARAPQTILHVCAGNLGISACTSLAFGLLLGARNVVKLPSKREDSFARQEILQFIRQLPEPLHKLVKTTSSVEANLLAQADVIIVFGSDATLQQLRARTRWNQRFIGYGHAVSLLWINDPARFTPRDARACAVDILTYDQLGCLSPQALYFPPGARIGRLGDLLATALEKEWSQLKVQPPRALATAARISEARELAFALGHRVWLPPRQHLGWTVIHDSDPAFRPSPLHGVIYLREVSLTRLSAALTSVCGRISTVGFTGKTSSRLESTFLSLGVSRFCKAGRMQFPPLSWHHDGRPALGDLVTWVDAEFSA